MNPLHQELEKLESIANNQNLNGGVWNSLKLFIKTSDRILKNKEFFFSYESESRFTNNEIIKELKSIRKNLEAQYGIPLEDKIASIMGRHDAHKFKTKFVKFMQSYQNHFL